MRTEKTVCEQIMLLWWCLKTPVNIKLNGCPTRSQNIKYFGTEKYVIYIKNITKISSFLINNHGNQLILMLKYIHWGSKLMSKHLKQLFYRF